MAAIFLDKFWQLTFSHFASRISIVHLVASHVLISSRGGWKLHLLCEDSAPYALPLKNPNDLVALVIWSKVTVFLLKSLITPNLVRVSMPRTRSKTGSGSASLIGMISGWVPTTLDIQKLGNFMSKLPTFVVVKVSLEIFYLAGTYLSLWGIFLRPLWWRSDCHLNYYQGEYARLSFALLQPY